MRRIELDGATLTKELLHEKLSGMLTLPSWYGRNLDALYDVLCEVRDVELVVRRWPQEGELAAALRVMRDAARENDELLLNVIEE